MRLSTMQIVLAADTRQFSDGLSQAERTAVSFASVASRQLNRVDKDLEALATALGVDIKEFEKLKASIKQNIAFDAAARSIQRLGIAAGGSAADIRKLEQQMGVVGRNQNLSSRFRQDSQAANALEGALTRLKLMIAGYIGFDALRDVAKTSVDLASMQKTFYALTGSMEGAREEISWLRSEAQRLGLDFFALTESFKGFSAAGNAAGMSAQETKAIFTSVSEAATVLGLNASKTKLALYALEQMLSKGSVTMEELRRQLGDQLPGAFQLAAKAMGMSTEELGKLIKTGNLASSTFLPKFAAVLREHYGPGLAEAMKTPRAELQRLVNTITFAKVEIGDGGFLQGLAEAAKELSAALQTDDMRAQLNQLGYSLGVVTGWMAQLVSLGIQNAHGILALGAGFGIAGAALKVLNPLLKIFGASTALLGPVGVAITAVTAGVTYLASQQSAGDKIAVKYATAIEAVKAEYIAAAIAAGDFADKQQQAAVSMEIANLEQTKKDLSALRQELSEAGGAFILATSGSAGVAMDQDILDTAAALRTLTHNMAWGGIQAEEFETELTSLSETLDAASKDALAPFIVRLVEGAYRIKGVKRVAAETSERLEGLKNGTIKAGESAEDAADKYMKLDAALKSVAKITELYNQITLSPKDFSLVSLQAEVDEYSKAIDSLVHNNKKAEASVASMQLAILHAGAGGAEADSIKEWAKERAKLADEIKKIELGETEFRKYQAEERYRVALAGLQAEREAILEQIALAEAQRADTTKLLEHLRGVSTQIESLQRNREGLISSWSSKAEQASKRDLKVQQDFWKEYARMTGAGYDEVVRISEEALRKQYEINVKAGVDWKKAYTLYLEQMKELAAQNPVSIEIQARQHKLDVGEGSFEDGAYAALSKVVGDYKNAAVELTAVWGDFFTSFTSGFANSVGQAIVYGDSLKDSLGEVARSSLAALVSGLTEMAIKWTLNRILLGSFAQEKVAADASMAASGSAAVQTQTAVSTAAAAETASAWGPAAGTAAVGSFGTAAVLAAAGIASVLAMIMAFKGFQQGGYTGSGRPDEVRGLVHAGEFVIPAPVVNQIGVPALEAFTRRGEIDVRSFAAMPAQWADRPAQPSQLKVSIENTGTPKDFTVQYVTADEVRFIASDIVHKETEPLMTSRLSNPNSKFSKALGNQTDTSRRR